MASGKKILHSLDRELRELRKTVASQTGVLATSSRYLADVRHEQADAYRTLSRLRLDQLREDRLSGELEASDKHARKLLERHAQLLSEAGEAAERSAREIDAIEERREERSARAEEATLALEAAIEATRERLAGDADYQAREAATEEARRVALQAANKADLAQADRVEKGAPYEADPLFMYLWERRYGTDTYTAAPLFRALDGWVARLCKYDGARRNYRLLTELPLRMQSHARHVAHLAEEAEAELAQLEEEAFLADGHGPVRERAEAEEDALEAVDAELEQAESAHLEQTGAHAALANGTDPTFREALETVLAALRDRDLRELRAEVERTPMPEDDELVEKLLELEEEEAFLQQRVAQESGAVEASEKTLGDLEWVRRKFKTARYDGPHAVFRGGDFLAGLVAQLTRRAISRDTFWTSLRRRFRSKAPQLSLPGGAPWGDFGGSGGSFGRSLSRTLGRMGRTSFPTVRPRSFGGGGFRSGGRIGGGGFKTGGGF